MANIAVIGCGRWGKHLIRNFADLNCLTTICCVDAQSATDMAKEFSVSSNTYPDILTDGSIDGIVIATNTHSHFELSKEALTHSKHVYVEKPISLNLMQSQELVALAKTNKRVLMTGHLLQYHPAFLKMKELVQDGIIGNIRKIHTRRLFMGRIRQTENVMWDLLPHDLSMVLGLIDGETTSIRASASATFGKCHDTVQASLAFSCGTTAYLSASWSFPTKEQSLTLIGNKGVLIFDDTAPWTQKIKHIPLTTASEGDDILLMPEDAEFVQIDMAEPLKLECAHFIDCIAHGHQPRTGPDEFLPVMHLCQQIHNIIGD